MNGPTTGSGPASVASVLESLSQLEINDCDDNDEDCRTPLKTLEARLIGYFYCSNLGFLNNVFRKWDLIKVFSLFCKI